MDAAAAVSRFSVVDLLSKFQTDSPRAPSLGQVARVAVVSGGRCSECQTACTMVGVDRPRDHRLHVRDDARCVSSGPTWTRRFLSRFRASSERKRRAFAYRCLCVRVPSHCSDAATVTVACPPPPWLVRKGTPLSLSLSLRTRRPTHRN